MLYCLTISLVFHKIYAHRPEFLDQTFLLCFFHSLIFFPVSRFFCHTLFILLLSFSSHFLSCVLSISFQIFIVILYNLICSHRYCPSHTVWSHVLNNSSVQLQDFCFLPCVHLLFSVVLRSQRIRTSLSVTLFR